MADRTDRHGWIDLLVPDGPFLSAAALDVQTVGENWPTRLSAEQRALLTTSPASKAEDDDGWDDSTWDIRRDRVAALLTELLGYLEGKTLAIAPKITAAHHIYRSRVTADFAIHALDDADDVRMVVICGPDATDDPTRIQPSRTHSHDGWVSTPVQRAALLARHAGADLALVTNGREHLLVNVVTGTTGSAMWTVNGLEDRHVRDAFVALLHKQRVLHRQASLSKLIELSQDRQHELTDTLGKQVRRAAEALVNAISRSNRTSRGRLLEGLTGQQVYAATTRVLMRTVFLLVAEERGLLPVAENQLYADQYAMSTLLDKLEEDAYRNRSAMERRAGAWQRMMALSRAVHAGIEHDNLRLPAYGGNLFDPDEHNFLEARVPTAEGEGHERLDVGVVDDFTVLTLLRHLQIANGRRISFRSLDVEQIGHVYEALLDHAAVIVEDDQVAVLGLLGKAGNEPEVPLVELETWATKSDKELGKQLADMGVAAEAKAVYKAIDDGLPPDSEVAQTLNVAVANDAVLRERVEPYAPLLRTDARGVALVFLPGDVYVTETSSKRDSGTAYTPRSLADEIAKHTLDPLLFDPGPQNELDESKWKLKKPDEILDLKICDPAVGSAAILVAAVRYLAEGLLQARVGAGELSEETLTSGASDVESVDERVQARRAIVSSCVYGIDRDPMAVEMAKLSLWLTTMARDEPFTFLDHAIRHGDSLTGVTSAEQLRSLSLFDNAPALSGKGGLFSDDDLAYHQALDERMSEAARLRTQLSGITGSTVTAELDRARLGRRADQAVASLERVASDVAFAALKTAGARESARTRERARVAAKIERCADFALYEPDLNPDREDPVPTAQRRPLHWVLSFPDVFAEERGGFDAVLGNPPYQGTRLLSRAIGTSRKKLVFERADLGGMSDYCLVFLRLALREWVRPGGTVGLLLTDKVRYGDNSVFGLADLVSEFHPYRVSVRNEWPTAAAKVRVCKVWFRRSRSGKDPIWNETRVSALSAQLEPAGRVTGRPFPQATAPTPLFTGAQNQLGDVLLMSDGDDWLERLRSEDSPFVRRWVTGRDLGQDHFAGNERYIFTTDGLDLDEVLAKAGPEARRFLETVVKPYRLESGLDYSSYPDLTDRWWQIFVPQASNFAALRATERAVAAPMTAKYWIFGEIPTDWMFTNKMAGMPIARRDQLTLMLSEQFRLWVWRYSSRMGKNYDLDLSTDALRTFPWPTERALSEPGECFLEVQANVGRAGIGATGVWNAICDPSSSESWVVEARQLIQLATSNVGEVLDCPAPQLDFVEWEDGSTRFASSEHARPEVLDVLLTRNFELTARERGCDVDSVIDEAQDG